MPHRPAFALWALLSLAALSPAAPSPNTEELPPPLPGVPLGPAKYRSELRAVDGPDTDDLTGPLLPGERIGVRVRAARGSPLQPTVRLLDPLGRDRTPSLRSSADGRGVSFRPFRIDRAGRWTVRVAAADGSEGAWEARIRLRRAGGPRRARVPGGSARALEIEACGHARLDLVARSTDDPAPALAGIDDPGGDPLRRLAGLPRTRGNALQLADLTLAGPAGGWRVRFDGGGPLQARWRLRPPPRPRGRVHPDPDEPRLDRARLPAALSAGTVVRLHGDHLANYPAPRVGVGARGATVLAVGPAGTWLDVRVPHDVAPGPAPLVVRNPDGQSDAVSIEVRPTAAPVPRPSAFEPAILRLETGGTATAILRLRGGMAGATGLTVPLAVEGDAATVAPSITVPPWSTSAIVAIAAVTPGTAVVRAGPAALRVVVSEDPSAPPPPAPGGTLDLSGWSLVQTTSSRTFTLPPGTVLARGDTLVVGRKAARAAFETFWGVASGGDWVYIDSGDRFPSVNGGETFSLRDADGTVVDGPSVVFATGTANERRAGAPAGGSLSWTSGSPATLHATPGEAPPSAGGNGTWISEVVDPTGTGNWRFEYVEIHFDGAP